jgi:cyclophilin family peptidyl-prolyl cis-trans isomerase
MKSLLAILLFAVLFPLTSCAQNQKMVVVETTYGTIKIKLYDETPLHRDNFIKLAQAGFYDSLLFHRVIRDFMIQGGDPNSKGAAPEAALGMGDPGYTIDAEIVYPARYHKKGALAAARQGDQTNPLKKSSGSQFYLVQGKVYTNEELDQLERVVTDGLRQAILKKYMNGQRDAFIRLQQLKDNEGLQKLFDAVSAEAKPEMDALVPFKLPQEHRDVYTTLGGTPRLDNAYTVFGEVVEGLEVIDKIALTETNNMDRPLQDVIMQVKIINE